MNQAISLGCAEALRDSKREMQHATRGIALLFICF